MNKKLKSWIPWIILVVVVLIALLFVDYNEVFNSDQTVGEKLDALITNEEVDDINDDVQYDEIINPAEEGDFVDIN
ncbi:MAG: hypothetical protein A2119_01585 [Candidatus Colwellbacteria bacterium GWA2_46_10]|uniref:Uncharacterized protein n=1 Tax=Candidatus Colwellbacteria bacterium GWA2_46_10 TaxID=1797684 RepID=A0A1G1YW18_9BACT|nr:MAG: hypothetical protein UX29_C0001G0058 [Parcubacteria group bacterium GW2011_GWA2_46_10]OGY56575.1 MAG: hypothetical protein A2119_01585 [Candidatus Colwellbacteria bacterium GWA2_46_10]